MFLLWCITFKFFEITCTVRKLHLHNALCNILIILVTHRKLYGPIFQDAWLLTIILLTISIYTWQNYRSLIRYFSGYGSLFGLFTFIFRLFPMANFKLLLYYFPQIFIQWNLYSISIIVVNKCFISIIIFIYKVRNVRKWVKL